MARATTAISTIVTQAPAPRQCRTARERTQLERAATLFERRGAGWAVNDSAEAYGWYRDYLADNYPTPGWGC